MATDPIRARPASRNIADTQPAEASSSRPPHTTSTSTVTSSALRPFHGRTRQAATVLGLLAALPAAAASRLTPALAPALAPAMAPSLAAAPESFGQGDGSAAAAGIGSWGGNLFFPPTLPTRPAPIYTGGDIVFTAAPNHSDTAALAYIAIGVGVALAGFALVSLAAHLMHRQMPAPTRPAATAHSLAINCEASVQEPGDIELGVRSGGPTVVVIHPAAP